MLPVLLLVSITVSAQRDTTRKQAVDIISSFKPSIRHASKINFSGSQLAADTAKPMLRYTIPSQNLFYAYEPVSLKPLALNADTNLYLGNRRYIKAGFGSYSTPYFETGLSFGDGKKTLVTLFGNYISSKGDIKNQDYSQLNVKAAISYFAPRHEVYGSALVRNDNYHLYGYDHALLDFNKEQIRQQLEEFAFKAGMRNTVANTLGIRYNPNIGVSLFTNRNKASETTVTVSLPVEKNFGENVLAKVELNGEFTNYNPVSASPDYSKIRNNLILLSPSLTFTRPLFKLHAGLTPVWNNGEYGILPNIFFEAQLQEKVFVLQGGWVGRYVKNTYRNLTNLNPYLEPVTFQMNTRETEFYGGLKTSVGSHLNLSAKASFISYKDMPLFINDTSSDTKSFLVSNEPSLNNFRIHADVSYVNQDKFTLSAGFNVNAYTGLQVNKKAWHTFPLEVTGSFRWLAFDKLILKSDLYIFEGGNALAKGGGSIPLQGGFDLSAGAEYKINKQFSAWLDVNNILNDKYERWNNYPVYGLNVLGGIIIKF